MQSSSPILHNGVEDVNLVGVEGFRTKTSLLSVEKAIEVLLELRQGHFSEYFRGNRKNAHTPEDLFPFFGILPIIPFLHSLGKIADSQHLQSRVKAFRIKEALLD